MVLKSKNDLVQTSLKKAIEYDDYRSLMARLVLEGKSTGIEQNQELVHYTRLNNQRMKRLDKSIKIDAKAELKIKKVTKKITWLVITESWCGDAAQTIPVINKVACLNDKISLRLVLRDENLELIAQFLSNGARAIPKLIAIDDASGNIIGDWGSRPSKVTEMVRDYKNKHGKITPEFKRDLQLWYTKDKGQHTVKDLLKLLDNQD